MHKLKTRAREGECGGSRSGKFCERRKRKSATVFKKLSSRASVGRSERSGARSDAGPPQQGAWSFATSCCLGRCVAFIVMGAVSELCASSFQTLLCPTLTSPSGAAGTVIAVVHQELTSAATGDQGWTEIEAGGAFVKLFARVQSPSELTPNLQPLTGRNINLTHDAAVCYCADCLEME